MNGRYPKLVRHSHYTDTPVDLTHRLFGNPTYFRSIRHPYSGINFALKLRFGEINTFVHPGDWVIFYDPMGVAYTFDYVQTVDYGLDQDPDTGTIFCSCRVVAQNWMNLLGKTEIYVPVGEVHPTTERGTVMSLGRWAKLNIKEAGDYMAGNIGQSLQRFHSNVAKVRLPASMGGGYLGDEIPVVYDEATANMYAQTRTIDPVGVGGGLPNNLSFNFYQSKVSEMYGRLFNPEPLLIEMYPSLEPRESGTAPLSGLANILNARPVLIYTLAPFRAEPLGKAIFVYNDFKANQLAVNDIRTMFSAIGTGKDPVGALESSARADPRVRANAAVQEYVLQNLFTKVTWDPSKAIDIGERAWRGLSLRYSDDDRVNVGTIGLSASPGSGIEAASLAGLPIMNGDSVENHGARLAKPAWSFTIPKGTQPNQPSNGKAWWAPRTAPTTSDIGQWIAYLRSIAAQIIQFHGNGHKFASGQFSATAFDVIVEHKPVGGNPIRGRRVAVNCGNMIRIPIRDESGINDLIGYAETVTHTISIDPDKGTISWAATVNYSRGVADSDKLTQFGKVPVTYEPGFGETSRGVAASPAPAALPPPAASEPAQSRASNGQCSMGAAYGPWPGDNEIDLGKVPSGLTAWAAARRFTRLPAGATPSRQRNELIVMACGYVIERYWKQRDPDAIIDFISTTPHGGAHNYGAAFDFAVRCNAFAGGIVPVFQSWAALSRLAKQGRMPFGGRGLYVNISSSGVKKGTYADRSFVGANPLSPLNCGNASPASKVGIYPPGSSGGTHYDFRGSFGLVSLGGSKRYNSNGDSWIWADSDGDGRDNYKLGEAGLGGGDRVYSEVHPAIKRYFLGGGSSDPTLHDVGGTIPNIMQVLGQVDSCFKEELQQDA